MDYQHHLDQLRQWFRYRQPTWLEQRLIGLYTDSIDIHWTMRRLASETSAEYVMKHMGTQPSFKDDYLLRQHTCQNWLDDTLDLVIETGVAGGRSIRQLARLLPNDTIWGFDSFEGLPSNWNPFYGKGSFRQERLPDVPNNVSLVQGLIEKTLPTWRQQHTGTIRLLHIDTDAYDPARQALKILSSGIVPGTVIIFDEYLNYPTWQQHEYRAWRDFVRETKIRYEYLGYVSRHQQVALRVISRPKTT